MFYPCSSVNPCNPRTKNEPIRKRFAYKVSHKRGENLFKEKSARFRVIRVIRVQKSLIAIEL